MSKLFSLSTGLVFALATCVWACPPDEGSTGGSYGTVAKEGGCQKGKATTVADKEGGCQKGKATTVADKEGGCQKGKATTVADKEGCCKKGQATTVADKGSGCCKTNALVAKVMAALPHVAYKVGDKATNCPEAAAEMAKASEGAKIVYLVGDKSFDQEWQAKAALAAALDGEAQNMLRVGYSVDGECVKCPMHAAETAKSKNTTVKYRVAGVEFATQEKADAAVNAAKAAMEKVVVAVKTGDKETTTASLDGEGKPGCGDHATFTVNGEQTECPIVAKVLLAQAKIRAMIEAAATVAS